MLGLSAVEGIHSVLSYRQFMKLPATDSGNTLRLRIDQRGRWDIGDDRDRKCASRKRTPLHL